MISHRRRINKIFVKPLAALLVVVVLVTGVCHCERSEAIPLRGGFALTKLAPGSRFGGEYRHQLNKLDEILDAQPEDRLSQDVFEKKVLPVLFRLCGEDGKILVDLYDKTGFARRYGVLVRLDDEKRIPPFLLGRIAAMVGNEYEHIHQSQWDRLLQDRKAEFEAFSPRLREALKKKWMKGVAYTTCEFSAFIKLLYEVLQRSDPSEREMLERHMCAFLDVGETYFPAFVKLADAPFEVDFVDALEDYISLRSFDKAVRLIKAREGLTAAVPKPTPTPSARTKLPWWRRLILRRRQPQEIVSPRQAQPPTQIDKKDAQLVLRELICMKALDVYLIQKELGLDHADLSHPRIQAALRPLIRQLQNAVGKEELLKRQKGLDPVLMEIRNGLIRDEDAIEKSVEELNSNLFQFTERLDILYALRPIDDTAQGAEEFKSVYIRGLILNKFLADCALEGLTIAEIYPEVTNSIVPLSFLNLHMDNMRRMALNYIRLGRLDLARKAYQDLFELQNLYKDYLTIVHDRKSRRKMLPNIYEENEKGIQFWQRRREAFYRTLERHTRYKDDASCVTAGVEMEFIVVNEHGELVKKIHPMRTQISDEGLEGVKWEDVMQVMKGELDGRFGLTMDEDSPELTSGFIIRDLDEILGNFLRTAPEEIEQDPVRFCPASLGRLTAQLVNELYLYGIERLPKAVGSAFEKYPQLAPFIGLASPEKARGLFVVPDNIHINLGEGYRYAKNYLGISLFEQVLTGRIKGDNAFAGVRSIQFLNPDIGRDNYNYRGKMELLTLRPCSRPFDLGDFRAYLSEEDFVYLRTHLPREAHFITTPPEVASRLKGQFEAALNGTQRRLQEGEALSLNGQTVIVSFLMALTSWYSKSSAGEGLYAGNDVKKFPWINTSQQETIRLAKFLKAEGLDTPILDGLNFRQMMNNILRDPDFIREYLLFFGSVPEYLALLAFAKPGASIPDISLPDAESKEALAEYPGQTPEIILNKWRAVYTQGNVPEEPAHFATSIEKENPYRKEPQHRLAFITSKDKLPTYGIDYLEFLIHPYKLGIRVPLSSPYVKWAYDRARSYLTEKKIGSPAHIGSFPFMRDYFPVVRDMIAANAKDDAELEWVCRMLDQAFNQLTREYVREVFTMNLIDTACIFAQQGKDINPRALIAAEINRLAIAGAGFKGANFLVVNMATTLLAQEERDGYFDRAADRFNAITRLEALCKEKGEAFERPLPTLLLIIMSLYLPNVDIDADRLFKWVDASNPYRMRQFIAPLLRLGEYMVVLYRASSDHIADLQAMRGLLLGLHQELSNKEPKDWPDFHGVMRVLNSSVERLNCKRPSLEPQSVISLRLIDAINRKIPPCPEESGNGVISLAEIKGPETVVVYLFNPSPIGSFNIEFISYKEAVSARIHFEAGEVLLDRHNQEVISRLAAKEKLEEIIAYLKEFGVAKISLSGISNITGPFGLEFFTEQRRMP